MFLGFIYLSACCPSFFTDTLTVPNSCWNSCIFNEYFIFSRKRPIEKCGDSERDTRFISLILPLNKRRRAILLTLSLTSLLSVCVFWRTNAKYYYQHCNLDAHWIMWLTNAWANIAKNYTSSSIAIIFSREYLNCECLRPRCYDFSTKANKLSPVIFSA